MTGAPTTWHYQDANWWTRERIIDLGETHGPAGPATANWLECHARHDGQVKAGYKTIARGAFLPGGPTQAEQIIARAVQIGFLTDFEEGTGGGPFTATVRAYVADQAAGRQAAAPRRADSPKPSKPAAAVNGADRRILFDGRLVPPARVRLAEQVLAAFNQRANTRYGSYTGAGKPSDALRRIIGALTAWPELDLARCERMIAYAFRERWWPGRGSVGVVFGPAVVEKLLEATMVPVGGSGDGFGVFERVGRVGGAVS